MLLLNGVGHTVTAKNNNNMLYIERGSLLRKIKIKTAALACGPKKSN